MPSGRNQHTDAEILQSIGADYLRPAETLPLPVHAVKAADYALEFARFASHALVAGIQTLDA
jgi:hypothetical protein